MKRVCCVALLFLTSCATISPKSVSLMGDEGQSFTGKLEYADPFSGTITMGNGPAGESFSGTFVVVDRTAVSSSGGVLMAPSLNSAQPVFGGAQGTSSGAIEAWGIWHAIGAKGGHMNCELQMGRQGHGSGTCKHISGKLYKMIL